MRIHLSLVLTASALTAVALGGDIAANFPARKPGQWELTQSYGQRNLPPQVQRVCLDAATDALLYKFGTGAAHQLCSKLDVHRSADTVAVDSVCRFGDSQLTSHSVYTYSGNTAYHEVVNVHYDPPLRGKTSDSQTLVDAKWLAACPADMKPGDMVNQPTPMMPVPMRMNLLEMLGHAD
jgi:hypothetical protein